ncbi:putative ankyrin repeat protein [Saudi moumouvirus]|nr:putative ankyrin repeat protein [Saudi moumouvirus]
MNKEIFKNKVYYTLLDSDFKFLDFEFKKGLNIQEKFYPPSNMKNNRIVFVDSNDPYHLFSSLKNDYGIISHFYGDLSITTKYLAELSIPFDHPDFQFIDKSYGLFNANMANLEKYYPIDKLDTYEYLISTNTKIEIRDVIEIAGKIKSKTLLEEVIKKYGVEKHYTILIKVILNNNYDDLVFDIIKMNIKYADYFARDSCRHTNKVYLIDKLVNSYGVDPEILERDTIWFENIEVLDYLISTSLEIEKAFYIACEINKPKIIRHLINKGINPLLELSKYNMIPIKPHDQRSAAKSLKNYLQLEENAEINNPPELKVEIEVINDLDESKEINNPPEKNLMTPKSKKQVKRSRKQVKASKKRVDLL